MNKSELLDWLQAEHQQWQALLKQIDPGHMEQVGVTTHWSIKDLIAHLIPDAVRCIDQLQAIQRHDAETPPPPWPAHLQNDDEINAWIYETNQARSVDHILEELEQTFQQLFTLVKELPEDVQIETVLQGDRSYYFVLSGEQRLQPGYIFDHFHDDHEQDVRAWLTQMEM
ncbi:MAG: ClbS/DfsB family four-helix bundle protein [Anaerolineae bacterium]|jgi:hypothetical protein|nr:ClbS/DfsB family four-helix bundle protein [Anaerolineae bacterium]